MEEQWKPYSMFFVSNFGRIKNKFGEIRDLIDRKHPPSIGGVGLHRIVYSLFIGDIPDGYYVYKKDRSISNCHIDNLILLTIDEKTTYDGKREQRTFFEDFEKRAREIHGNEYSYDKNSFKSITQRVDIICPKHGIFKQRAIDHCKGHKCKKCQSDKMKSWTKEQDQFLIDNYVCKGVIECSEFLNKSKNATYARAKLLGVAKKTKMHKDGRIPDTIFSNMRRQSIVKDIDKNKVDVTREFLEELFDNQGGLCALSGFPINLSHNPKEMTASLDRINSSKGYEKGNVQWVHRDINWMKNKFSDKYFYKMCRAVDHYRPDLIDNELVLEENEWLETSFPRRREKDLSGEFIIKHPVKVIKEIDFDDILIKIT